MPTRAPRSTPVLGCGPARSRRAGRPRVRACGLAYAVVNLGAACGAQAHGAQPCQIGVPIAVLDEAIGRGRADMRTPLNLASLQAEGLVRQLADATWAFDPGRRRMAARG